MRPWLLDLYAGEGGAAHGYVEAGFNVFGVDWKDHRVRYMEATVGVPLYLNGIPLIANSPRSWVDDILDWTEKSIVNLVTTHGFSAIHASPPCQFITELNNNKSRHVNLIPHTRCLLQATGLPYVIENVRAAADHLIAPISLFGTMFDNHLVTSKGQRFDLSRERCFETNWKLAPPSSYATRYDGVFFPVANVYGGHLRARSGPYRTGSGTGRTVDFPGEDRPALARQLMGMPWATMAGMSEAVPPSYTREIGRQLLEEIARRKAA